jgi:tRNA-Thr(GGU) m(6)t(6)A37 methyltransferase TsaA
MKQRFEVETIGMIQKTEDGYAIHLEEPFGEGLTNLEGFSHLQVVWWGHLTDSSKHRKNLLAEGLFRKGPEKIGVFGTRSPARPNPLLISTIQITRLDASQGLILTPFIDAEEGTPVLDIKPYFPMERVKDCRVPPCFEQWPWWFEDTMTFNWRNEINME